MRFYLHMHSMQIQHAMMQSKQLFFTILDELLTIHSLQIFAHAFQENLNEKRN